MLTGTSSKQLACLSRFQKVRDAIWADPSIDLARRAFAAGYSDQPHMTREFRRYSGQTTSSFAREAMAKKKCLAAHDVAFVQERPAPDG
jgi:AraC-like DNA-binding protein